MSCAPDAPTPLYIGSCCGPPNRLPSDPKSKNPANMSVGDCCVYGALSLWLGSANASAGVAMSAAAARVAAAAGRARLVRLRMGFPFGFFTLPVGSDMTIARNRSRSLRALGVSFSTHGCARPDHGDRPNCTNVIVRAGGSGDKPSDIMEAAARELPVLQRDDRSSNVFNSYRTTLKPYVLHIQANRSHTVGKQSAGGSSHDHFNALYSNMCSHRIRRRFST